MANVDEIVNNLKCIGCMACISLCKYGNGLETKEGKFGFPVPIKDKNCDNCGTCLSECPSVEKDE